VLLYDDGVAAHASSSCVLTGGFGPLPPFVFVTLPVNNDAACKGPHPGDPHSSRVPSACFPCRVENERSDPLLVPGAGARCLCARAGPAVPHSRQRMLLHITLLQIAPFPSWPAPLCVSLPPLSG
jgi:hypothetical protein